MFASKILVKTISSVLLIHSYQQKHAFDTSMPNRWYDSIYRISIFDFSTYQQFAPSPVDNFYTGYILVILTFIGDVEKSP